MLHLKSYCHWFWIIALYIVLNTFAFAQESSEVVLHNELWTVTVEPHSLQLIAKPDGKEPVQISLAQQNLGDLESLKQTENEVSWEIPQKNISVSFRLDGSQLFAKFLSKSAGSFTWPMLNSDGPVQAYILPLFEGSYVPADDAKWMEFLIDRGTMDTTEGLSMPFWGLDCGNYTVTCILTNPFNNELAFENHDKRLGISFTHNFARNWNIKEYGLVICLGDASPIEPAKQYRQWLINQGEFISMKEKIRQVPEVEKLLGAAHIYLWGDGVSEKMMEQFLAMGFDRLWLGLDSWNNGIDNPQVVSKAKELGYLIGPYDSYHSIHHPDEPDTWETAQFDLELYEKGPIVRANGKKIPGFNKKGYKLSPIAARPYVEKRVNGIMDKVRYNSWFIDCDAYGEIYDDFSELHPATQLDDMNARMDRISWIRDTYQTVVGSEGGAAYAAPTIHFAHGMMTPVIGWGDPDLKNKESVYYLGGYWPPEGPKVFTKQVPLKPEYYHFFFDPRFRLPLYQTVFHDSVIATHQWGSASLKFKDQVGTVELLELLYNVPPLYHINLEEFKKHGKRMKKHYDFFSSLHKETALLQMTDFVWLTPDHLVQRTVFGENVEMVANFGTEKFNYGSSIPEFSIMAKWLDSGKVKIFKIDN